MVLIRRGMQTKCKAIDLHSGLVLQTKLQGNLICNSGLPASQIARQASSENGMRCAARAQAHRGQHTPKAYHGEAEKG
jgi:hypothetical protein